METHSLAQAECRIEPRRHGDDRLALEKRRPGLHWRGEVVNGKGGELVREGMATTREATAKKGKV